MSTKHELQSQAAKLQDELEKLNKTIASMKDELPHGFVPFEATELDAPPCHPQDLVEIMTKIWKKDFKTKEAKQYRWSKGNHDFDVVAYKIVKKYVESRPMKYSEIPVGQWFMWEKDTAVYMKTNRTDLSSVCIKGGGYCEVGRSTNFSENLKFYSVDSGMTRGQLLTVEQPPEPVEDKYFTMKHSDTFGDGEGAYLMGRRPDGVWFSINKYGQRKYQGSSGHAFGKSEGFDGYVSKGSWIQTTLESAFKK